MCNLSFKKIYFVEEKEAADEVGEAKGGEVEGRGEGELDHHVVGAMGGGTREDELGGDGDEDA